MRTLYIPELGGQLDSHYTDGHIRAMAHNMKAIPFIEAGPLRHKLLELIKEGDCGEGGSELADEINRLFEGEE